MGWRGLPTSPAPPCSKRATQRTTHTFGLQVVGRPRQMRRPASAHGTWQAARAVRGGGMHVCRRQGLPSPTPGGGASSRCGDARGGGGAQLSFSRFLPSLRAEATMVREQREATRAEAEAAA